MVIQASKKKNGHTINILKGHLNNLSTYKTTNQGSQPRQVTDI
jgi:hypothetical protein